MVESWYKGFQADLEIGHTPPERITHYAVSCYDYKSNNAYPYYTIRHWIPAIQYTRLCQYMQGNSKHPGDAGASKTWWRVQRLEALPRLAAAEPLNQLGGLSHTGKGGSVDRRWVHQTQEDQHWCTHSQLQG